MKRKFFLPGLFMTAFFFFCHIAFCQKNNGNLPDSSLESNSEKWKVKQHRGLFGISKPEFGPYTTIESGKLDSPVIKKKTKDSSGTGVSISGEGWDISKFETIEKKKLYRMRISMDADTIGIMFSIYSVSVQKNQTILGEILSKNDEGKNATLSYKKNIAGILVTRFDAQPSRFFMEDYVSTRQITGNYNTGITGGYIVTQDDSLFTEPIMHAVGKPTSAYFFEWQEGLFVNNAKGRHIALLKFGDGQSPFYIRIHKDLRAGQQQSIASVFALLIAVAGL